MQIKTLHYHKNYQYNATCKSKHYTTIKTTNICKCKSKQHYYKKTNNIM